jgi:hypothetical protein
MEFRAADVDAPRGEGCVEQMHALLPPAAARYAAL